MNIENFIEIRCPCDVMVKALDCGILVRKFEIQSRFYVHFQINTLEKGMNPFIQPFVS